MSISAMMSHREYIHWHTYTHTHTHTHTTHTYIKGAGVKRKWGVVKIKLRGESEDLV